MHTEKLEADQLVEQKEAFALFQVASLSITISDLI